MQDGRNSTETCMQANLWLSAAYTWASLILGLGCGGGQETWGLAWRREEEEEEERWGNG